MHSQNLLASQQPSDNKQELKPFIQRIDEDQQNLIGSNHELSPTKVEEKQVQKEEGVIDPLEELTKNNNVAPLLAVLHMIDLNIEVDSKPLINKLCTMNIPLAQHLKGRQIVFKKDSDNRTALHQAIAADDIAAANWCFQNGIGNVKDNFGSSPIIEAIKLGRKSCFLLCLHYQFYDSQSPHFCASYNRTWQLKILHRMGYDVTSARDSEHFTPLERAVAHYSFEAAQYLTQITDRVSPSYLATKTDSKGIIRTIEKAYNKKSFTAKAFPLLLVFLNIILVYSALFRFEFYQKYASHLQLALFALVGLYALLYLLGHFSNSQPTFSLRNVNFMALLGAPEFPPLEDICPECITLQNPKKDHCRKCEKCVENFHFHGLTCVNKKNEIFWLLIEVFWFFIVYRLHQILMNNLRLQNLLINNFSNNFFFRNAVILDQLYKSDLLLFAWFTYLKVFLLYQFFCCFQWLFMLVLNRTYQQVNNTEKYKRLYRVVKTTEGSYKNQQIKLMEKGVLSAVCQGISNTATYFLK